MGVNIALSEPGVDVRYVWHSVIDGRTCTTCLHLDGKTYTDSDVNGGILYDMFWGPIYDLEAGTSLAHGDPVRIIGTIGYNCRCYVDAIVTVTPAELPEVASMEELLTGSPQGEFGPGGYRDMFSLLQEGGA